MLKSSQPKMNYESCHENRPNNTNTNVRPMVFLYGYNVEAQGTKIFTPYPFCYIRNAPRPIFGQDLQTLLNTIETARRKQDVEFIRNLYALMLSTIATQCPWLYFESPISYTFFQLQTKIDSGSNITLQKRDHAHSQLQPVINANIATTNSHTTLSSIHILFKDPKRREEGPLRAPTRHPRAHSHEMGAGSPRRSSSGHYRTFR